MSIQNLFENAVKLCPLVAILRGITPDEVTHITDVLVECGFSIIEVPLNSPQPLESIARLATRYGNNVLIGAGTVLTCNHVSDVRAAGGRLIVSPNTDAAVIRATIAARMVSLPGYLTPSEGFAGLAAGAHGLKLFPAEAASPDILKAQLAVLPKDKPIFTVGGVTPDNLSIWLKAGATGAGLGSALYKAGDSAAAVRTKAEAFIQALALARESPD